MIVSFLNRLAIYISLLGFFIYVITPGFSFLIGDGYEVNEYAWFLVIPVGISFLFKEVKRYRRTNPGKSFKP